MLCKEAPEVWQDSVPEEGACPAGPASSLLHPVCLCEPEWTAAGISGAAGPDLGSHVPVLLLIITLRLCTGEGEITALIPFEADGLGAKGRSILCSALVFPSCRQQSSFVTGGLVHCSFGGLSVPGTFYHQFLLYVYFY